jgi:hypothetical protein
MLHERLISKMAIAVWMWACSAPGLAIENDPDEAVRPLDAVWHLQRIEFNYHSTSIYYSCDGLRHKVVAIMKAIGARDDVRIDTRCPSDAVVNHAATMITVATPIAATPENVAALTTYSTESQLAARLNKKHLPTANDIERFSAGWRKVTLSGMRGARLDAGDCELLNGLIDQVFPRLPVRVLKRRNSCSQGRASRVGATLHVAALMAAPVIPLAYAPTK